MLLSTAISSRHLLISLSSLSEYGCNTNTRKFEEVASLYGSQMTPVYSGGVVYEYTQAENKYGLVTLNGNSVSELPDFTALKTALAGTPNPTGNGGAKTSGTPSQCPPKSDTWIVDTDDLPAMPAKAVQYLTKGAGKGPGLKGNNGLGSQNAGSPSESTAVAGTATPSRTGTAVATGSAATGTSTSTAGSKSGSNSTSFGLRSAPSSSWAPLLSALAVVVSTAIGALLL